MSTTTRTTGADLGNALDAVRRLRRYWATRQGCTGSEAEQRAATVILLTIDQAVEAWLVEGVDINEAIDTAATQLQRRTFDLDNGLELEVDPVQLPYRRHAAASLRIITA